MFQIKRDVFRVIHVGFLIICIVFMGILVTQYQAHREEELDDLDESVDVMVAGVQERLDSINKLYFVLELYIDTYLTDVIDEMNQAYEEGNLDADQLESIKGYNPYLDLYVIDENDKILYSTLEEDKNLDFSEYEEFVVFFDDLRRHKQFVSERIDIGLNTNEITKYSYQSTKDGHYILDASYKVSMFDDLLVGNTFIEFSSDVFLNNNYTTSLELYEYTNTFESSMRKIYPKDMIDEMIAVKNARETGEASSFVKKINGYDIKTVFIPHTIKHLKGSKSIFIYKMTYTNEYVIKELNRQYMILVAVFIIFAIVFIGSSVYYNNTTLTPLFMLLKGFEEIRKENFKVRLAVSGVKSVRDAVTTFNDMAESIDSLIGDKEAIAEDLRRHLKENEGGYLSTVTAMANAIEAKDNYTGGHCERVMQMSILLAEYIKLSDDDVRHLMYASLLHDIGKIGIGDAILNKKGKFTKDEYALMKKHPEIGYNILSGIEFLHRANDAILTHHERVDGSGYPNNLKESEIPYLGKILCITDAFDAMTSRRVYRRSHMTIKEAFNELENCSGTHFDSELVSQFKAAYKTAYGKDLNYFADEIE